MAGKRALLRAAALAVVGGLVITMSLPSAYWMLVHPGRQALGLAILAGLLVAAPFIGYALRGAPRWKTYLCCAFASVGVLAYASTVFTPVPPLATRALSVLLQVMTFGAVALVLRGFYVGLPWLWLLFVLPALTWQGFFEGYLGVAQSRDGARAASQQRT